MESVKVEPSKEKVSSNDGTTSPETRANLFSKLTFWWFNSLLSYGSKNVLDLNDTPTLKDDLTSQTCGDKFSQNWAHEKELAADQKASLFRALRKSFGFPFYMAGFIKLTTDGLQMVNPIFINQIIKYCTTSDAPLYVGYMWVIALLVSQTACNVLQNWYFHIVFQVSLRTRSSLVSSVYRKSLNLSNAARQSMTTGEIVNLMSIDSQRLSDSVPYLHMMWSSLVQIAICLGMLANYIGVSTVVGLGAMFVMLPFQARIGLRLMTLRKATLKYTDVRTKTMNEVLQGIRAIKFYVWEKSFAQKLAGVRENELKNVRKAAVLRAVLGSVMVVAPILVSVVTFICYAGLGNELTAATIFTSLAYFGLLRFPMLFLPMLINSTAESKVSIQRIQRFLLAEESVPTERNAVDSPVAVRVQDCDIAWVQLPKTEDPAGARGKKGGKSKKKSSKKDGSSTTASSSPAATSASPQKESNKAAAAETKKPVITTVLKDVSFEVPKGGLTVVCGAVGSGKSTLLSGLLGEAKLQKGRVEVHGSLAYCPQQAWIQNTTLKENITFGAAFDPVKYAEAVRVTALEKDIAMLPAGDATEIGEKGINLSGGQKQRVSLARSVYFNAEIFFFDDCLSAVDAHVGKHIFDHCIDGLLKPKTRILVTHQLQYLPYADQVIFLADGKIAEIGTYQSLMAKDSEFSQMVSKHIAHLSEEEQQAAREEKESSVADAKAKAEENTSTATAEKEPKKEAPEKKGAALMVAEERATGAVAGQVYWAYIAAAGGAIILVIVILNYVMVQFCVAGNQWWLALWSSSFFTPNPGLGFYMGIYVAWAVASALFQFICDYTFLRSSIRAAKTLHESAFKRVLRAPMSFFDTTPVGRILNRFSKDQDSIDGPLVEALKSFMSCAAGVIGTCILIIIITPLFAVILLPVFVLYFWIQQYYRNTSRELKRIESISRSPIYSHFSETLGGLSTIRAYAEGDRFMRDSQLKINNFHRAAYTQLCAQRWLSLRLEFIGNSIMFFAAIFAVIGRGTVNPGLVGLSLTYALSVTSILNWMVRQGAETEAQMNAVERVEHYAKHLEQEAPEEIEEGRPSEAWPTNGEITFEKVEMRYRKELDPVLRGVSFTIKGGEKVGIVGRTGAGKSSLMVSLFRLAEVCGGRILIDGVDISKIGVSDLRRKLAIIPQDPVLFSGTVRSNLDPFRDPSLGDDELWTVLRRSHLAPAIEKLQNKLDSEVTESGENFSVGQRQLVCLARAMLRNAKILIMDEATASVDMQTDSYIQETVRSEFAKCTVLTIAHRLNTIVDYDRILVLDHGNVAEFGTPAELLKDPNSILSSLVDETGPANARMLRSIAFGEPLSPASSAGGAPLLGSGGSSEDKETEEAASTVEVSVPEVAIATD